MIEQVFNIVVNAICLGGYMYLASVQFLEIRRLPNRITPLRWLIFAVFMVAILTIIPVLTYQWTVIQGDPSETLRSIATVLSPVSRLATLILIIAVVNFRIREEE